MAKWNEELTAHMADVVYRQTCYAMGMEIDEEDASSAMFTQHAIAVSEAE